MNVRHQILFMKNNTKDNKKIYIVTVEAAYSTMTMFTIQKVKHSIEL